MKRAGVYKAGKKRKGDGVDEGRPRVQLSHGGSSAHTSKGSRGMNGVVLPNSRVLDEEIILRAFILGISSVALIITPYHRPIEGALCGQVFSLFLSAILPYNNLSSPSLKPNSSHVSAISMGL